MIHKWKRDPVVSYEQFEERGQEQRDDEEQVGTGWVEGITDHVVEEAAHRAHGHSNSSGRTGRDKGMTDFLSSSRDSAFRISNASSSLSPE
jgi:hypothetical protein